MTASFEYSEEKNPKNPNQICASARDVIFFFGAVGDLRSGWHRLRKTRISFKIFEEGFKKYEPSVLSDRKST